MDRIARFIGIGDCFYIHGSGRLPCGLAGRVHIAVFSHIMKGVIQNIDPVCNNLNSTLFVTAMTDSTDYLLLLVQMQF